MTDNETIELLEKHLFTAPLKLIEHDAKQASKKAGFKIDPKRSFIRIEQQEAFTGGIAVRRLIRYTKPGEDKPKTVTFEVTDFPDFVKSSAMKAASDGRGRLAVSGLYKVFGRKIKNATSEAAREIKKGLQEGQTVVLKPLFTDSEEEANRVELSIFRFSSHEKDIKPAEFIEEILGDEGKAKLSDLFSGLS